MSNFFKNLFTQRQKEFSGVSTEQNKIPCAENIVNDYGQAIVKATELNKIKVKEFKNNMNTESIKSFKENGAIYYHLQNKFNISFIQHDKDIIKESIEYLLQNETNATAIEQLKTGLSYLNDFIDFNEIES